jgi:signal peptidase I
MILVPVKSGVAGFESHICTLSETGWAIWQKLDGVKTLRHVAKSLVEKFSSTQKEIEKDVLGFIAELISYGLCIPLNFVEEKKHEDIPSKTLPSVDQSCDQVFSSFLKLVDLPYPEQLELLFVLKERGLTVRISVGGASMTPFIRSQDILTIKWLNNTPLRIGQVVVFKHWRCEDLVIHRIITKGDSGWVIKGDNCLKSDGDVPMDNIIGLVTHVERNGKKVLLCLGPERQIIALLNRCNGLFLLKKMLRISRRAFKSFFYKKEGQIYDK